MNRAQLFRSLKLLFFSAAIAYSVPIASALEWNAGLSAIQLPNSDYLFQGYQTHLSGKIGGGSYTWSFSGVRPYEVLGYRHWIGSSSFTRELSLYGGSRTGFFDPFVGIGPGIYVDQVNSTRGIVPSLVTRGGVRIGMKSLGLIAQFETHAGIYSLNQLKSWVIWPMTQLSGGVYVAF